MIKPLSAALYYAPTTKQQFNKYFVSLILTCCGNLGKSERARIWVSPRAIARITTVPEPRANAAFISIAALGLTKLRRRSNKVTFSSESTLIYCSEFVFGLRMNPHLPQIKKVGLTLTPKLVLVVLTDAKVRILLLKKLILIGLTHSQRESRYSKHIRFPQQGDFA